VNTLQDVFDTLADSTTFWVVAGIAGLAALCSFVGGGRRG
jgi:hypothetical protein